jgi:hypothetical protein
MVRRFGFLLVLTLLGCGMETDGQSLVEEGRTGIQAGLRTRSLLFGAGHRLPSGRTFVDVCSSNGTSCTLVEIYPGTAEPQGYSLQQRCDYGIGCRSVAQYRGRTVERCTYGGGCQPVPAFLPRAEERCFYGSGCELFPIFGP